MATNCAEYGKRRAGDPAKWPKVLKQQSICLSCEHFKNLLVKNIYVLGLIILPGQIYKTNNLP
jgi:hypothetical protein